MGTGRLQRSEWGVVVFALVVCVALLTATATSTASFSPYNAQWQGGSELQAIATTAGTESDVILDTAAYDAVPAVGTVAVVLSPERAYTPTETATVRRFVRTGGTLLVAEDFGPHSNGLLAALGAESRLDGRLLVDEQAYYNSPTMPVARTETTASLLTDVDTFTLNHGTYVVPNGAQVLVESSEFATVLDEAGTPVSTSLGPYPFVTAERIGAGSVIVVADSSALVNVMLDRPGNAAFVRNVFARHDRVLLDYSHGANVPPVGRAVEAVQTSPALQVALGMAAVLALALLTTLLDRGIVPARARNRGGAPPRSPRPPDHRRTVGSRLRPSASRLDERALTAQLRRTRPEWDAARIERVARAIQELSSESAAEPNDR